MRSDHSTTTDRRLLRRKAPSALQKGLLIASLFGLSTAPALAQPPGNLTGSFDGAPMNEALARSIAGGLPLLSWGDCTFAGPDANTLEYRNQLPVAQRRVEVPCFSVTVQRRNAINTYLLGEDHCQPTGDIHACVGGYSTLMRSRMTIEQVRDRPQMTVRTRYFVTGAQPTNPRRGQAATPALTMPLQMIGGANILYSMGGGYVRYSIQTVDAQNRPTGATTVGEEPVYLPRLSNADACEAYGTSVTAAGSGVTGTISAGIEAVGTGAGGLAFGPPGAFVVGTLSLGPSALVAAVGGVHSVLSGYAAEGICNVALDEINPPPPPAPPPPVYVPMLPPGSTPRDSAGTVVCLEWTYIGDSSEWDEESGTLTVTQGEVICTMYGFI